ncbi:MAG TPA: hypothetical protein VNU65_08530 [Xanthobacteraceae bacterium]|nr:hypothetical protein [Xanthobacteraceae bacterium]
MRAAGAAFALCQPIAWIFGFRKRDLRERNTEIGAQCRKELGIFDLGDGFGAVAEETPSFAEPLQHLRPILESSAADDADGLAPSTERRQRVDNGVPINSTRQAAGEAGVRMRNVQGVLIAEEISHQRQIAAAPRRGRKRSSGNGGDEDRRRVSH